MTRRLASAIGIVVILALALTTSACAPAVPRLGQGEVEEFVRQYVAATNAADAQKLMAMVHRDPTVSSIGYGRIYRGWDAIRAATDENIAAAARIKLVIGTIDVTPLGPDAALAVSPMTLSGVYKIGPTTMTEKPGALTLVVKRTPEGLRLIHEHYSLRF